MDTNEWQLIGQPSGPGGLRYFRRRGHQGVWVADESGPTPDRTDQGPTKLTGTASVVVAATGPGKLDGGRFAATLFTEGGGAVGVPISELTWCCTSDLLHVEGVELDAFVTETARFLFRVACATGKCELP